MNVYECVRVPVCVCNPVLFLQSLVLDNLTTVDLSTFSPPASTGDGTGSGVFTSIQRHALPLFAFNVSRCA